MLMLNLYEEICKFILPVNLNFFELNLMLIKMYVSERKINLGRITIHLKSDKIMQDFGS